MKNKKIAIIGAGPSGLSAAYALRKKGYNEVTIFEKNNRVGGMSLSKTYNAPNGKKIIYEMGSVQPYGSFKLWRLLKEYGIKLGKDRRNPFEKYNKNEGYGKVYSVADKSFVVDFTKHKLGFPFSMGLVSDLIKLTKIFIKNRKLMKPSFYQFDDKELEELSLPFQEWIKKQKFKVIEDFIYATLGTLLSGCSYDEKGGSPIIFGLKGMLLQVFPPYNYVMGHFSLVNQGYQELWNRVSMDYNVILNSKITSIKREVTSTGISKVKIINNDIEQEFDDLILSCSLTNLVGIVDFTAKELEIINKIEYSPLWNVAFLGKKPVKNVENCVLIDGMNGRNKKPVLSTIINYGQVQDDIWLYSGIVGLAKPDTGELVKALDYSKQVLKEHLGIEVIEWVDQMYWPQYSSYFNSKEIKNGIYREFEGLQGNNNTFYAGLIVAGMCHCRSLEYSFDLVERFFI